MVDVFISYPRAARAKVEPIRARLEAIGLDCFFDVDGIDGGAEFPLVIDGAVKAAKVVLGCWSPSAFTRPWVLQECRVGKARGVLVPVAIERFNELEVPTEFFGIKYLDLVGWDGSDAHEGWVGTLRALGKLVGRELTPNALQLTRISDEAAEPERRRREEEAIRSRVEQEEEQRDADAKRVARELALQIWLEDNRRSHPAMMRPQAIWRDPIPALSESFRPLMVTIPPGKFLMGSPPTEEGRFDSEGPQHEVQIAYAFALGKFLVSFEQWDGAIAAGAPLRPIAHGPQGWSASDQGWGRGKRPVIGVTWGDAQAYVAWLNDQLRESCDGPYRLPSEAEWEYACRAGTTTPYSFGKTISIAQANYNGQRVGKLERPGRTTPVGAYPPNAFGLHDMHGSVYEWCEDGWMEHYDGAPTDGSARYTDDMPVVRGGSWYDDAKQLRSASRTWPSSPMLVSEVGFRVARTL